MVLFWVGMKIGRKIFLISVGVLVFAALSIFCVFWMRSPVLIVVEQAFVDLYGTGRIRNESILASFALFRPIRAVVISNEAGDDIVPFAVSEVSKRPFCVLFPRRFVHPALLYCEQNPNIPTVLLNGRYSQNDSEYPSLFVYGTDIDSEFYNAGLIASALSPEFSGRIGVFTEPGIQSDARNAFLRALHDQGKSAETMFFTSFSEFPANLDFSCVILAGTGIELLEQNLGIPVILFSWVSPSMVPQDIAAVVNDSPWAQVSQAASFAAAGLKNAVIPSNFHVIERNKIDRGVLQLIKNTW